MNAKCFHDFDISDWNMYRYSLNKRRAGDEARPKSLCLFCMKNGFIRLGFKKSKLSILSEEALLEL